MARRGTSSFELLASRPVPDISVALAQRSRTELLTLDSTTNAKPSIDDYAERTRETVAAWSSMDGKPGGDPARLADALVQLAGLKEPPVRFAAGADALQTLETKAKALLAQADAHRDLSSSLAHGDA
jgi:hypothetical protein